MVLQRATLFWAGFAAIAAGILLHVPMLLTAHDMGRHFSAMPMTADMIVGTVLILAGVVAACIGAIPPRRRSQAANAEAIYEAPDSTPLGRWHVVTLAILTLGLVIDVMKPATLGFVLPGLKDEYGLRGGSAAWLPFVALSGTTVGSYLWGWMADRIGRRTSILLSTILFISTSICGAMPAFQWNLLMCFLMGCSAGGMLPVVYALLAETMPPRHRSWVLVLIGGLGLVGGYFAASASAHLLEPAYGWRILWLQGFPTGILLLVLARWIPESPSFLVAQGHTAELERMIARFSLAPRPTVVTHDESPEDHRRLARLMIALVVTALVWSFVNFGVLLWLPTDLAARGYSVRLASDIITRSALLALPTIAVVAWLYSRWSSRGTLVGTIVVTLLGLLGALLPAAMLSQDVVLVAVVGLLIVGSNGTIAVLLPYTAENYALASRGKATGLVAGASKFGGVAMQAVALSGFALSLAGTSAFLIVPMAIAAILVALTGLETGGRSFKALAKVR